MILEEQQSTFQIILTGLIIYGIQKATFLGLGIDTSGFVFSLEIIYVLMMLLSVIIMAVLNVVFKKNKDVVGMTFMLITSIKVVIIAIIGKAYILPGKNQLERWNFFGLFAVFLFLETYLVARRLNRTEF